ncbi:MAG: NAD/FAD-binding protein [Alphaproteobacteria bacterium]|nr:NAD/FAD-binding protein [Alphaproteobacteria bacterium]
MRIAIIGTGAAGLAAAYLLAERHELVLYEANGWLGGHAHTVDVATATGEVAVDTGFIVYNERNYPNLSAAFARLNVATEASEMSFSVASADGRLEYAGSSLATLFADRRNLLRPRFYGMLADILRFNRQAAVDLARGRLAGLSLADYLDRLRLGRACRAHYLLPMAAAIWSSSTADILRFPAASFVRFFVNHGLMQLSNRPHWRTVTAGSRRYVAAIARDFRRQVRLNTQVTLVSRQAREVRLRDANGGDERFDQVIFACEADRALALLADATGAERAILGGFGYSENRVVLHGDASVMPLRRRVWSSWNYRLAESREDGRPPTLHYWMNRLQNLSTAPPLFITLNPHDGAPRGRVFGEYRYRHPRFDAASLAAQRRLHLLQGSRRSWFCGSYFGYGFHEDAFTAGLKVAEALGARRPWQAERRLLCELPPAWAEGKLAA